MEIREYAEIIKKQSRLFLGIIILLITAAFLYFYLLPVSYNTSITLNITRIGVQKTDQYKYDDFYRIQADDKFSETVVEWLKSPRIISDIYQESGIDPKNLSLRQLSKAIKPEKLSSQVISVSYSSPDQKTAQNIAKAATKIISQNTQNLNKDQGEETWFEVVSQEPVIRKNIANPVIILIVSLLVGIFLAFWVVMVKHYLK